jgi:hypothetical protein
MRMMWVGEERVGSLDSTYVFAHTQMNLHNSGQGEGQRRRYIYHLSPLPCHTYARSMRTYQHRTVCRVH